MPAIKRSEACIECKEQPPRVRKGKRFPLCEDCRRAATTRKWKVRSALRKLRDEVGHVVEFNQGEGWRTGYLVRIMSINAEVQPIGSIGRIPDLITCCLSDVKVPTCGSASMPTIDDFYRKMKANRPKSDTARSALVPLSIEPLTVAPAFTRADEISKHNSAPFIHGEKDDATKGQAKKVDKEYPPESIKVLEGMAPVTARSGAFVPVEKDDQVFAAKMQKHRALLEQPPLMFS